MKSPKPSRLRALRILKHHSGISSEYSYFNLLSYQQAVLVVIYFISNAYLEDVINDSESDKNIVYAACQLAAIEFISQMKDVYLSDFAFQLYSSKASDVYLFWQVF